MTRKSSRRAAGDRARRGPARRLQFPAKKGDAADAARRAGFLGPCAFCGRTDGLYRDDSGHAACAHHLPKFKKARLWGLVTPRGLPVIYGDRTLAEEDRDTDERLALFEVEEVTTSRGAK